jgi:poly-beta-1,6-N-acetyl-D-glucosamine synthase
MSLPSYVLVTPARNEEAFIGATIEAIIRQDHRPVCWVIVSDGSTDRTDEIVSRHCAEHAWIRLLRLPSHPDRQFGAKAKAFNAGYQSMRDLVFDVVGNLDADITVGPHYFRRLLSRFAADPQLGVAGTPFAEDASRPDRHAYAHKGANLDHVSGACQLFRRACFEAVGGYVPIKGGGIDWVAVTTARMKGWKTRTFTDQVCLHHRPIGTAETGRLGARFHYGRKAYYVGGHPLWEAVRAVAQMRRPPLLLGGLCFYAGYFWAWLSRTPRAVSAELMAFHRAEQMRRLGRLLRWHRAGVALEEGDVAP